MRLESRPIEMIGRRMNEFLAVVKEAVGTEFGADPSRVGLVTNATSGVGAVLRSIKWSAGDEIVISNQGYNAVRQAVHSCCERFGCKAVVVDLPLPVQNPTTIIDRFMRGITARTRLVIVDHITSPTALILPVTEIARGCRDAGVLCLIDGAHAPGMIPLQVDAIGADWYTGNLHKWVCAPKGCAFLVASAEVAPWTHPETTSHFHGHGFAAEFDWQGTRDFANWLAIPAAIDFVRNAYPGGLMVHNQQLAQWAQRRLCHSWGTSPICGEHEAMVGSIAAIPLPPEVATRFASAVVFQAHLYERHNIEVPIVDWGGGWYARISAQAYNRESDYLALDFAVGLAGGLAVPADRSGRVG